MSNKIDIIIEQVPKWVCFECPHCLFDADIDFDEFENMMASEYPYWQQEEFCCPTCGKVIEIDEVEWD